MDETQRKLAARLASVATASLVEELDRRGFDVVGEGRRAAQDPGESRAFRLSHFPDRVLQAAAGERGLEVTKRYRSGMDTVQPQPARSESLLGSLEDTYTRGEMERAYQAMLELRRHRKKR